MLSEHLHYILVVLVILVIICFQLRCFFDTKKKIREYLKIFPKAESDYAVFDVHISDDAGDLLPDTVSQIEVKSSNGTMKNIVRALNMYLQKNKGAAGDFHLMKDVVERYCDAEAEEISTQQPIPLYLGLMGTMVGIIIGIGSIAFAGDSLIGHITELMACVAIAMGASLVGVLCTTLIADLSKSAVSEVEADKNRFYSYLQTELLPTLSGNTNNALHLLQQNIATFNLSFKRNVDNLNDAIGQIKGLSQQQMRLIELINKLDITKTAQANIEVLRELKGCTGEIETFNEYLHSVQGYLNAVNGLNSNLNEHLNRTRAIEDMGVFFKEEIEQVNLRKQAISRAVTDMDVALKVSLEALKDNTKEGLSAFKNFSASSFSSLENTLKEENSAFADYIKTQRNILGQKAQEIDSIVQALQEFSGTQKAFSELLSASKEQNQKLERLISAIQSLEAPLSIPAASDESHNGSGNGLIIKPKQMRIGGIVVLSMVAVLFILRLIEFIVNII